MSNLGQHITFTIANADFRFELYLALHLRGNLNGFLVVVVLHMGLVAISFQHMLYYSTLYLYCF